MNYSTMLKLTKNELSILLSTMQILNSKDQKKLETTYGSISALYNKLYTVSEQL